MGNPFERFMGAEEVKGPEVKTAYECADAELAAAKKAETPAAKRLSLGFAAMTLAAVLSHAAEGAERKILQGGTPVTPNAAAPEEASPKFNMHDPRDPENKRTLDEMKADPSFKTQEQLKLMRDVEAEIKRLGGK